MCKHKFIEWRESTFKLNSGILSHVYVFGREDTTDNPVLEWMLGRKTAHVIQAASRPDDKQICLIGIPTAGTAIAQATAMVSWKEGILINKQVICHRIMREIQKVGHGDHVHQENWVNGKPNTSKHTYGDVDNVATNADSKFKARKRLEASGYPVEDMFSFIFVDRQQGGVQRMEKAGISRIIVAYKLLDLTYALGEMKLWPKEAVKQVDEEIRAHQFL
jgi:orotate phosphoribosyltransferase